MPPAARASQKMQMHQDANRNHAQIATDFAALSRLLNMPQSADQLIPKALEVSARLLPEGWSLRLFESVGPGTAFREIVSSTDRQVVRAQESKMTLGFGEAIDRQVTQEHMPVWTEHMVFLPLIDASEALVGVLGAMHQSETTDSTTAADVSILTAVGAHLTTLLARGTAERLNASSLVAVRALAGLALPTADQHATPEHGETPSAAISESLEAAQERLLNNVVVVLDEVIEAAGYANTAMALAVMRTRSGKWKVLGAGDSLRKVTLLLSDEGVASITRLEVRGQRNIVEPPEVSAKSNPDLWAAFEPLRARLAVRDKVEVDHVTLLPITGSERQVVALLCLAWRTAINADLAQLYSVVTTIAVGATAGARSLHLAELAQAEGRARDAFISLAAHELRSPLTSIKGYAQLLMRQSKKHALPESMLHSVESIEQQCVRMAEMVGELLDASRIQRAVLEVQISPVDVVPLARRVVERRAALFPQHAITLVVGEESVVAVADGQRVEQVLRDLIDNGARHMPRGGTVKVTLSQRDGRAQFTVQDEGIGIPEEEREHIFDYLYRSSLSEHKNLSGLGLGLYISRHLVERFGGALWLEASSTSEPTGSEFRFTLPLAVTPMEDLPEDMPHVRHS